MDDIAERYLDLIDALSDEIEELEDGVEQWDAQQVRGRISDLRHDMLRIRRTLAPLRDAIRQVVDDRIDFDGRRSLLVAHVGLQLRGGVRQSLVACPRRVSSLSGDLVAGARDFHQSEGGCNDQNVRS